MKDYFKNIQSLLIVVLVVIILLMRSCSGGNDPIEPKIVTEIEVRYDTVETVKETYIPKYITRYETDIDTFRAPIDTVAILRDYYAKYFYSDTLLIDTIGYAIINDTITKNTILARDVKSNIFIPTTTITNTVYLYNREFFGGISVGATNQAVQNINGEILYVNKKRNAYGFGVGLNPDFQPIFTGRIYWKIGK